ncbi:XVIPCD domain-containing protein [Xanthomonas sp. 60]
MPDRRDIEHLLQGLGQQSGLPKRAREDIGKAIDTSPYLASVMSRAIDLGTLRRIEVSSQPNESGHYDDKTGTVSISRTLFAPDNESDRLDMLAGTLGHETGHALMALSAKESLQTFVYNLDVAIKEGIRYGEPVVDVTAQAKQYVAASRQNEALAELVSMNSVASRVVTVTGKWSEPELLSRLELTTACVKDGMLEPGIYLDARGMQRPGNSIASPAVEAVAVCHFDKSNSTLGVQGRSNYPGYYAAYTVSAGAALLRERSAATTQVLPRLGYDLAELGTEVAELEGAGVSLGGQGKVFGFVDTSNGQRRDVEVRQMGPLQHRPELEVATIGSIKKMLADNPGHSDHSTYARIQDWVRGTGNWTDEESRNVSAALYKQQAEHPLVKRVDQVTGGLGRDGAHNVFAVYAPFGDKGPFFHAHVDGRQAAHEPAQQNLQQAESLQQAQALRQALEQTQQNIQQQDQGSKMVMGGP